MGSPSRRGEAAEVHVVHRHDPPDFSPADWSFVDPLMDLTVEIPGWFRNLAPEEQKAVAGRFWAEGRLKLVTLAHPEAHQPSGSPPPERLGR